MDVKITINISTRAFDPCNDVAMKWDDVGYDLCSVDFRAAVLQPWDYNTL